VETAAVQSKAYRYSSPSRLQFMVSWMNPEGVIGSAPRGSVAGVTDAPACLTSRPSEERYGVPGPGTRVHRSGMKPAASALSHGRRWFARPPAAIYQEVAS
jgi:hypothetical protein